MLEDLVKPFTDALKADMLENDYSMDIGSSACVTGTDCAVIISVRPDRTLDVEILMDKPLHVDVSIHELMEQANKDKKDEGAGEQC